MTVDECWQGAVFYNAQGGFELMALIEMKRTTFEWLKKETCPQSGSSRRPSACKMNALALSYGDINKYIYLLLYVFKFWDLRWYHKFCHGKRRLHFKIQGKKNLKFIFFRIWSLHFSSYTSYGFLIAKGRTLNSQNSARISIDLESVSDCVYFLWFVIKF